MPRWNRPPAASIGNRCINVIAGRQLGIVREGTNEIIGYLEDGGAVVIGLGLGWRVMIVALAVMLGGA